MHMGHRRSRGGGRGTESRQGGTYWGRLTCNRNTQARVTFRLRSVLRDNRSSLRGYERVSSGSESAGFTGENSVC